jgi:hypothetical protein
MEGLMRHDDGHLYWPRRLDEHRGQRLHRHLLRNNGARSFGLTDHGIAEQHHQFTLAIAR